MQVRKFRLPKVLWAALIVTLAWNMLVYSGSRVITQGFHHYNMELQIDRLCPFVPWTVSIYLICYLFWAVNYVIAIHQPEEKAWQFLSGEFFAKTCCLICFLFIPTTNVRPAVGDAGIWNMLMKLVYGMDAADNLFPSIHCLVSWFCFIAVRDNEKIPKWYRIFSFVFAMMVVISTLTTKQHVIVDAISGIALAEICYRLAGRSGFAKKYQQVFYRIFRHNK